MNNMDAVMTVELPQEPDLALATFMERASDEEKATLAHMARRVPIVSTRLFVLRTVFARIGVSFEKLPEKAKGVVNYRVRSMQVLPGWQLAPLANEYLELYVPGKLKRSYQSLTDRKETVEDVMYWHVEIDTI